MSCKLDSSECAELAAALLGMGDDWEDEEQVWVKLWDDHEIDEENFCWLINELVPLIDIAESPLTRLVYKGFSRSMKPGLNEWLAKVECPEFKERIRSSFIPRILVEEVEDGTNGYTFQIVKKGKTREKFLVEVKRVAGDETE